MKVQVIGLGYVGLPLALRLSRKFEVTGVDVSEDRVSSLQLGIDTNNEYDEKTILASKISFLSVTAARECLSDVYIITVPTPIDAGNKPDLSILIEATRYVARKIKKGDLVSYESTVYPGATNEICVPILEEVSELKVNVDFELGYSPERVSPGANGRQINEITKVISSNTPKGLELMTAVYSPVTDMGLHLAESVEVAEFAKVLENTQRDLNIALVNEVSHICNRLNLRTNDVLDAAKTKWNFLNFQPGLVGGHCIGVDPYYLLYRSEEIGYMPEVIAAGRRINEKMSDFVARRMVKELLKLDKRPSCTTVALFGMTFKENCPDYRNSKSFDIARYLIDYGFQVDCFDIYNEHFKCDIPVDKVPKIDAKFDGIIVAVPHFEYNERGIGYFLDFISNQEKPIIFDVKGIFNSDICMEL